MGEAMHKCALLLSTLLLMNCTGQTSDGADDLVDYPQGDLEPSRLYGAGGVVVRTQTFVADGSRLVDLELLVARGEVHSNENLIVEIRNKGFDRRFGHGTIEPFRGRTGVVDWRKVQWEVTPEIEHEGQYNLVVFSEADHGSWWIGAGEDSYPRGKILGQTNDDLGFRIQYEGGVITSSKLLAPRTPIEEHARDRADLGWGLKNLGELIPGHWGRRLLPVCLDSRCTDISATPLGGANERASRAKESTEICDGSRTEAATVLKMTRPELGLSCTDVCRGHGFQGCSGTRISVGVCAAPNLDARRASCDRTLSEWPDYERVSCYCIDEQIYDEPIEDSDRLSAQIRSTFELDANHRPVPKKDKHPSGFTCLQACDEFDRPACKKHEDCSKFVMPWNSSCPVCGPRGVDPWFKEHTQVISDKIVVPYRGHSWVIDPTTGAVSEAGEPGLEGSNADNEVGKHPELGAYVWIENRAFVEKNKCVESVECIDVEAPFDDKAIAVVEVDR